MHNNAPKVKIRKLNKVLNMPFNCSMHDCRRTYAYIAYYYAHAPIDWIRRQPGHEKASQTGDYIVDILEREENRIQPMLSSFRANNDFSGKRKSSET